METMKGSKTSNENSVPLSKAPTGIAGLDEITRGGLPAGRPTLVCGGAGCGKTVLAMEFLVRGALEFGEPGLFVSFEESTEDLHLNFKSFGFDLKELVDQNKLHISHVQLSRHEIVEAGAFTLDGLFVRLKQGIEKVGAKRVVFDTMETLFSCLSSSGSLRSEVARLFKWLKEKDLTVVMTGERGSSELTRHGFEEYVSDCVLLLDHRVSDQVSKRRLRIVKYRGSSHGMDEYPFLISDTGFSTLPVSSIHLDHTVSPDRINTGVPDLDEIMGGQGYFRGSSVLLSGAAGAGKTTLAVSFAAETCRRGEKCLYLAFEESASQLVRNMRSVGIDLQPWIDQGLLRIQARRPTLFGMEEHIMTIFRQTREFEPKTVVIDPITNFLSIGSSGEVKSLLTRILDQIRGLGATVMLTSLTPGDSTVENSEAGVSSMMDTWIALDQQMKGNVRGCYLFLLKSRGMKHSHEVCELTMSASGISLHPIPTKGHESIPQREDSGANEENG